MLGALCVFLLLQGQLNSAKKYRKLLIEESRMLDQDDQLLHDFSICVDPGTCDIDKISMMGKSRYEARQNIISEEKNLFGM